MRRAQKWVILGAILAMTLLVLFPPWQQKYKGFRLSYKGDLGRHFLWAPPKPTGEQSWMVNAPPPECEVALDPEVMIRQGYMIIAVTAILLFVFRRPLVEDSAGSGTRIGRFG